MTPEKLAKILTDNNLKFNECKISHDNPQLNMFGSINFESKSECNSFNIIV